MFVHCTVGDQFMLCSWRHVPWWGLTVSLNCFFCWGSMLETQFHAQVFPKAQIFFPNGDMAILSCYQRMNQGSVWAKVAMDESRSHQFLIMFCRGWFCFYKCCLCVSQATHGIRSGQDVVVNLKLCLEWASGIQHGILCRIHLILKKYFRQYANILYSCMLK